MQRRRHRTMRDNSNTGAVVMLVLFVIAFLIFINSALKPVIMNMAESYGKMSVAKAVDGAVSELFEREDIGYSDLVKLTFSDSGFVTAVEYNSAEINRIKLALSNSLVSSLEKLRASKIKVPIGSITGNAYLSGRGLSLRLRIMQSSVPVIEVISSFESEGINTVLHRIIIRITVESDAYLPPRKVSFSLTQDFVIAQTIIVGDIPSGYADIG
ncbi:MAG: sporulation protein YunB [Oscillospiraceae bacterium]|nr:sporulation protein YunB [Oscillospiraceae bacterium]